MSKEYIMECNHTKELEASLHGSKVFPLVAELNKHFGLKVISQVAVNDYGKQPESGNGVKGYVMANDYGIPKCIAFIRSERMSTYIKDKEVLKDVYVFKYGEDFKQGGNYYERSLCTSVKLTQLIRAVKKYRYTEGDGFPAYNETGDANYRTRNKFNLNSDYADLSCCFKSNGKDMWKLKNEKDEAEVKQLQKHIPFLIDNYINNVAPSAEIDARIREDYNRAQSYIGKIEELKGMIADGLNPGFTAVGVDGAEGYVVGSIETLTRGATGELKYTDFKRYAELKDYPKHQDILPTLTMHKIRLKETCKDFNLSIYKDYFGVYLSGGNSYSSAKLDDFTGVFWCTTQIHNSPLKMTWLLLPNVSAV